MFSEHHFGLLSKKYILELKLIYPIIAENEPCDKIICLHVLANCIV